MYRLGLIVLIILSFSRFPLVAEEPFAAASGVEQGASNSWKDWTFAASALVTASLGVLIVSTSAGASDAGVHSH